jgi:hypothetical protein
MDGFPITIKRTNSETKSIKSIPNSNKDNRGAGN